MTNPAAPAPRPVPARAPDPNPVARCVLGTSGIRDEAGWPLLDRFVTAGGTWIDTARVYGGGTSERAVGTWIGRNRPSLRVLGKGAHPPNCRPEAVAADLTRSLETLHLDRIDTYLLHRDDPDVPVDEFVDALETEYRAGRIGAYGGSNWTYHRLVEANEYARRSRARGMTVVSNHFSLAEPVEPLYPGCESTPPELRVHLTATRITLAPWSAQGRGFFVDVDRRRLDPNVWRCWDTPDNRDRRDRARELGRRLDTPAVNVALGFVLSQPFPTLPIIGPQTVDELAIALRGASLRLDEETLRWLQYGEQATA